MPAIQPHNTALRLSSAMKPHFRSALNDDGVLEMCVYEEIGEDFWTGAGVTADSVKQTLDNAGKYDRIAVRINSPGGDAFEGIAIRSLLRAQAKPVDVYIDGVAASAASIIAMAGDTITMSSGTMMMIHDAWSMCVGKDEDMRKMADTLEKVSDSIAQVYVDRTGKSLAEVKALMDEETWLGAQECVAQGFATAVTTHENKSALALGAKFKNLVDAKQPKAVVEALKSIQNDEEETTEPEPNSGCPMQSEEGEEMTDALATANATIAQLQARVAELEAAPQAAPPQQTTEEAQPQASEVPPEPEESNLSQFEARLKMLRVA